MIYIQLLKDTGILENDVIVPRKSGEWLEVPRNVAIRLLIEERARVLDYKPLIADYGEIDIYTGLDSKVCQIFGLTPVTTVGNGMNASNNILINGDLESPITILIGLQALQNWHVAIPLSGQLINSYGDGKHKQDTKAIIRDLRVPAYNPDILFWRNSEYAGKWLIEYNDLTDPAIDQHHALIRSLYITKPYHIALPAGSIR